MNKNFMLLDRVNNLQKSANVVVKFNFEQKDYLVYSIDENDTNSQIFVSRLISNSDGKYFIDNILPEEKNKLNNIVYNIVILLPTEAQKGISFDILSSNLLTKYDTKLVGNIPNMEMQDYYSNCSVAITSKLLVDTAIKFYSDNLSVVPVEPVLSVPTWTAPTSVTAPVDVNDNRPIDNNVIAAPVIGNNNVPVTTDVTAVSSEVIESPVVPNSPVTPVVSVTSEPVVPVTQTVPAASVNIVQEAAVVPSVSVQSNPQLEKLAVVSDPSLGIGVTQPNLGKNKEAGFANTKYVIIGTVCLVLAITTVVVAYILINNMK